MVFANTLAAIDGNFTGLLDTISLETFTDLGFKNVTEENFEYVLGILASQFIYVSEGEIESVIVSEEDAVNFVEEMDGVLAEEFFEDWIEDFNSINEDLIAGTWSNNFNLSPDTRTALEAAYVENEGPLSTLEIFEIIFEFENIVENEEAIQF